MLKHRLMLLGLCQAMALLPAAYANTQASEAQTQSSAQSAQLALNIAATLSMGPVTDNNPAQSIALSGVSGDEFTVETKEKFQIKFKVTLKQDAAHIQSQIAKWQQGAWQPMAKPELTSKLGEPSDLVVEHEGLEAYRLSIVVTQP